MKTRDFSQNSKCVLAAIAVGTIAVLGLSGKAPAGPQNWDVVNGTVTFQTPDGVNWVINATNGSIVNYSSFNIASNQTVQFIQPSEFARVLNRITGGSPTSIDGALSANGFVFFVNPAGVIFGNNAVVNVGGIYAAAADIDNNAFITAANMPNGMGVYPFTDLDGNVIVEAGANINALHAAHLIGQRIANHGMISVSGNNGVITMTANTGDVMISEIGGNYMVTIAPGGPSIGGIGIDHTGSAQANNNGRIKLGAGDVYSLALRLENSGISGTQVDFAGDVTLDSDVTITAGKATFHGTVDSGATPFRSLSIVDGGIFGSADAQFNGVVGGSGQMGHISAGRHLTFADALNAAGNVTAGTGSALFHGPSLIGGSVMAGQNATFNDISSIGVNVAVGNNVAFADNAHVGGGVSAGNNAVFGHHAHVGGNVGAKNVTFGMHAHVGGTVDANDGNALFGTGADVGGSVLAKNNVTFAGTSSVGSNVTATNGTAFFFGNATIGGHVFAGASANFLGAGTVAGNVTAVNNDATFGDNSQIGGSVLAGRHVIFGENANVGLFVSAGENAIFGKNATISAGVQAGNFATFGHNASVAANVLAQHIAFGNNASVGGTAQATQGNVTFGHNALVGGSVLANNNALFAGEADVSGNVVATNGAASFGGHATLGGDVTAGLSVAFADGATFTRSGSQFVTAGHVIDAYGSMTKLGSGHLTLGGLGGIALHGPVLVTSGNLNVLNDAMLGGGLVTTSGNQTYSGDVSLAANTTLNASNVMFAGSLEGPFGLTSNANTTFSGVVNLGSLAVNGLTTMNGSLVRTSGDQIYNGAVTLGSNVEIHSLNGDISLLSTVDGPFGLVVRADSETATVLFGGNVGQSSPLASLETIVQGSIVLDATLLQAMGDILINDQVVIAVPAFATIGASGDLQIISLNGNFRMGQNQKMSVLGDLTISAANGTAVLSDLNTLGDMTVTANSILLLTRPGGQVSTGASVVQDQGLDFVAGGSFFFSVVPVAIGGGSMPQFSNPRGDGDALGTLSSFLMRAYGEEITTAMLRDGGTFFDLRAQGPTMDNLADALAGDLPDDSERTEISDEVQLSVDDIELLRSINIPVRLLGPEELADLANGRGIYFDQPQLELLLGPSEVAVNRVLTRYVPLVADSYIALFGAVPTTAEGVTIQEQRAAEIRQSLRLSWINFQRALPGVDAVEFGDYLSRRAADSPEAAQTLEHLRNMRRMNDHFQKIGLSRSEARRLPMQAVYQQVTPGNMTEDRLHRAVEALGTF